MPRSRCEPPVPSKIHIRPSGRLPFLYVLSEFDALGLATDGLGLWETLQRVRDWYASPPDGSTPQPQGGEANLDRLDPELRLSLTALDRLLRDPDPDQPTLEAVAFACLNAALWAEERGAYRTALGFLHAAEDVDPDNAHYAYNLGRVARKLAFYEEAEAWLKWAHYVARSDGRWEVATLALSGLGNLHRQRGNLPMARRYHEAARRMARLRGLRTLEGDALYDLAVMNFARGESRVGFEYAREALRAYGPGHGQVYHLAGDIAWLWIEHMGEFENAVHVLATLLRHVWKPPVRLLVLANLCRAAAAAGLTSTFESTWVEAWGMVQVGSNREGHAAALIQLARAAGNVGSWERALLAAREALEIARDRKEGEMILDAESIVDVVDRYVVTDAVERVFRDRGRARHRNEQATELASQLADAMRARRDNAPESPTHALIRPWAGPVRPV